MPLLKLQNLRALVTGGSAGLGAEVARQLSQQGVRVVVNYANNKARAEETLATLKGDGHVLVQGNAFDRAGIKDIVQQSMKALGGLDIVVSNAGWTKFGEFNDLHALADEDWQRTYQCNVLAHLWLMQDVQEELKKNSGSFVISASVAGMRPSGSSMAYSVSKAACVHLTKSLAKACAPEIRVNAVAPGLMLTDWAKGFSAEKIAAAENAAALGKVSEIDDVADMFVSLIRNSSTTGQIVEVSSGIAV